MEILRVFRGIEMMRAFSGLQESAAAESVALD